MKKYADIKSIYTIKNVANGCLEICILGKRKFVYFFKIEPIVVINNSSFSKEELIGKYEEFLRNLNIDFQIIIQTEKIDTNDYFFSSLSREYEEKNVMRQKYIENIQSLIKTSKIYITKYYLLISSDNEVENVEKYIKMFDESELTLKKIISKSEIEKIIMKEVN